MKKTLLAVLVSGAMMLSACSPAVESDMTGTESSEIFETEEVTTTETSLETTSYELVEGVDYITFGNYDQVGDDVDGPAPIKWLILSEEDGRMLLISRYIVDYQPYNEELTDITWEDSTLRAWLNDDFLNSAFDASEQERILTVTNQNPDNSGFGTTVEGGNDTEDKIFLLSIDEVETYFANDEERAVEACDWWWLRSPGFGSHYAAIVLSCGIVHSRGHYVVFNYYDHGVRPAMWVDLSED